MSLPPLALDIDGTLTTGEGRIDHRLFQRLPEWDAPIVVATGKSFPYPVALCQFLGLPEYVIAENGGVVLIDDTLRFTADRDRITRAVETFHDRGGSLGWGDVDTVNRWRETEVAVTLDADESRLRAVADEFDLRVLDTGYAYHLTDPQTTKATGLEVASELLDLDPSAFVAVGDSENDAPLFRLAGTAYAVGNADDAAKRAADHVLDGSYAGATCRLLDRLAADAPDTDTTAAKDNTD